MKVKLPASPAQQRALANKTGIELKRLRLAAAGEIALTRAELAKIYDETSPTAAPN